MMEQGTAWEFQEGVQPYGGEMLTGNAVLDKSFLFALRIVKFSKKLRDEDWGDAARQVFKCCTSIGANVHEAQDAESRDDFIHKMKIAAKEAVEARFWLKLCKYAEELPYEEGLLEELQEIRRLLATIIIRSRQNRVR
jgi:four helix bundle protein